MAYQEVFLSDWEQNLHPQYGITTHISTPEATAARSSMALSWPSSAQDASFSNTLTTSLDGVNHRSLRQEEIVRGLQIQNRIKAERVRLPDPPAHPSTADEEHSDSTVSTGERRGRSSL